MSLTFTKPSVALGLPRMGAGNERHTDTNSLLSAGVLIAYKARAGYPTLQMKDKINRAAVQARNIVRIANDALARVVMLRGEESALFTATMARHYSLTAGNLGGTLAVPFLKDNIVNKPFSLAALTDIDRRWVLNRIREDMLSISFHLNTGVYLIDIDDGVRNVEDGQRMPLNQIDNDGTVGYVQRRTGTAAASICGFRNGEIHISFAEFLNYSLNSCACTIIHEACHKYLSFRGDVYGFYADYPPPLTDPRSSPAGTACSLRNCDSLAWTAVSLATGAVRMDQNDSDDDEQCPGNAI